MKLSVIVATRNRGYAVGACLDSVAAALVRAFPLDAEVIVVDNGSTDDTAHILGAWAGTSPVPARVLSEPRAGKARALNLALRAARGELLAFTDDDCKLHCDYVTDLLRYASDDTELVLRGGRIEPGDPDDLPFAIDTRPARMRWTLTPTAAWQENVERGVTGCNMAMPRALVERIGPFDEDFGPGSPVGSADDTEYAFRAYLSGVTLEHVPDMTVFHCHGRKTSDAAYASLRRYMIGQGALTIKFGVKYPVLWRQTYWDMKDVVKEIITRSNTFQADIGFSHRDKLACMMRGALTYLFVREHPGARTAWDEECRRARAASPAA
jgi:GT2 family glycosyltransferase